MRAWARVGILGGVGIRTAPVLRLVLPVVDKHLQTEQGIAGGRRGGHTFRRHRGSVPRGRRLGMRQLRRQVRRPRYRRLGVEPGWIQGGPSQRRVDVYSCNFCKQISVLDSRENSENMFFFLIFEIFGAQGMCVYQNYFSFNCTNELLIAKKNLVNYCTTG